MPLGLFPAILGVLGNIPTRGIGTCERSRNGRQRGRLRPLRAQMKRRRKRSALNHCARTCPELLADSFPLAKCRASGTRPPCRQAGRQFERRFARPDFNGNRNSTALIYIDEKEEGSAVAAAVGAIKGAPQKLMEVL